MREYRTPLPQMLASSLEAAVNRVLALDPAATERLQRLEGKVLELDIEGIGITLFLTTRYGVMHIGLDAAGDADTVIRGTPFGLFSMAAPVDTESWGLPGSSVHISGDANLARDVERLFRQLDPDWEGQLSVLFGDVLGFQLSSGLRQGASTLREALKTTARMAGSYLRDEAPQLVRPGEFSALGKEIESLQTALDRLERQLAGLENRRQ